MTLRHMMLERGAHSNWAKNRAIYGWDKPKVPPKPKKEMPFKATHRHEYWSIDVRYIEHHQLPNIKGPVYVISILEKFSQSLPVNGTRSGYIRFRRWRFYAEAGLAKQEVQVSFYTSTLKIEYQETELAALTRWNGRITNASKR